MAHLYNFSLCFCITILDGETKEGIYFTQHTLLVCAVSFHHYGSFPFFSVVWAFTKTRPVEFFFRQNEVGITMLGEAYQVPKSHHHSTPHYPGDVFWCVASSDRWGTHNLRLLLCVELEECLEYSFSSPPQFSRLSLSPLSKIIFWKRREVYTLSILVSEQCDSWLIHTCRVLTSKEFWA